MPKETRSKKYDLKGWLFIISTLAFVLALWFYYPSLGAKFKESTGVASYTEMGVFGDSYGALNTLFSALAFTGIIASIYFQREELKVTRGELEATREEMKSQGEQFSLQTKAMQKQVFETTFFNMVSLHNAITSKLRDGNGFSKLYEALLECARYAHLDKDADFEINLRIVYDRFMHEQYDKIGHYYRYVYQILKFIDASKLHENEKMVYSNILRAQMSNYELILLFVNCICYERSNKFKLLVEKAAFFEHVYYRDIEALLMWMNDNAYISSVEFNNKYVLDNIKKLYSPLAFGQ